MFTDRKQQSELKHKHIILSYILKHTEIATSPTFKSLHKTSTRQSTAFTITAWYFVIQIVFILTNPVNIMINESTRIKKKIQQWGYFKSILLLFTLAVMFSLATMPIQSACSQKNRHSLERATALNINTAWSYCDRIPSSPSSHISM